MATERWREGRRWSRDGEEASGVQKRLLGPFSATSTYAPKVSSVTENRWSVWLLFNANPLLLIFTRPLSICLNADRLMKCRATLTLKTHFFDLFSISFVLLMVRDDFQLLKNLLPPPDIKAFICCHYIITCRDTASASHAHPQCPPASWLNLVKNCIVANSSSL